MGSIRRRPTIVALVASIALSSCVLVPALATEAQVEGASLRQDASQVLVVSADAQTDGAPLDLVEADASTAGTLVDNDLLAEGPGVAASSDSSAISDGGLSLDADAVSPDTPHLIAG